MRSFLIGATLITLALVALLALGGVWLEAAAPLHPGDFFFSLQDFVEQQRVRLTPDPIARASYLLILVERRVNDLSLRAGSEHESAAIHALDRAFDQAALAIAGLPDEQAKELRAGLLAFAQRASAILKTLSVAPGQDAELYAAFETKLETLLLMLDSAKVTSSDLGRISGVSIAPDAAPAAQNSAVEPQTVNGVSISFPPGSRGAVHAFYPLTGQHALLECKACHGEGKYQGTVNTCEGCHLAEKPLRHFEGDCVTCHNPIGWQDVTFDHALNGATDCQNCHAKDAPQNHYGGQCSTCHITENWKNVHFDHTAAGASDCKVCHANKAPQNHYEGQCSKCHNTNNWKEVNFDHTGFTDCVKCHTANKPAGHYEGQCSKCHNTNNWKEVNFDHSGQTDCQSCHSGKAPAGHYSGQCSNCHNTSSWQNVTFDHSGQTNCQSCHSGKAPAGHYSGQCSKCHNTSSWKDVNFDHSGQTDCQSCHAGNAPSGHYSGQCSACHSTSTWSGASFNHNGQNDCQSCHAGDAPGGIPFFDLKYQRRTGAGGESQILPVRLRLAEVEEVLVQPYQQREILLRCRRRQVRPLRRGENEQRA